MRGEEADGGGGAGPRDRGRRGGWGGGGGGGKVGDARWEMREGVGEDGGVEGQAEASEGVGGVGGELQQVDGGRVFPLSFVRWRGVQYDGLCGWGVGGR